MLSHAHTHDYTRRQQGSTLMMITLILFTFMSASVIMAQSQVTHAQAAAAQFNKIQAEIAAEAGVYAAFDATGSLPATVLDDFNGRVVSYEAAISGSASPFTIESTGSVTVAGFTYYGHVSATVSDGAIIHWGFH